MRNLENFACKQLVYHNVKRLARCPRRFTQLARIYIILDGLEGDTRIYCQRC